MRWAVVAPYFETGEDQWISDAANSQTHSFSLIPRIGAERDWHRSSARAGVDEWANRARQAKAAFDDPNVGVITVFPQLAAAAGVYKMVKDHNRPLVAWLFNTEGLNSRIKRTIAKAPLGLVDRFVVHSTAEIDGYSKLLKIPRGRFEFVPLQYGAAVETRAPQGQQEPYVFATGTGHRDYETFFKAVSRLGLRTLVLASDRALAGLTLPPNVEIIDQVSRPEIRRLVRHAKVNVVPLDDRGLTAGLVTIVETLRHGRSLVITNRPGLEDYCIHGETSLRANLFDPASMADAIDRMWSDDDLRIKLDANALEFAEQNCTDEAAAQHLVRILDSVT